MAVKSPIHRRIPLFFERLSVQERINFARHLAIVVKAGLPVIEGLRVIRTQITSRVLKEVVDRMISDVERGQSLADSLEYHRHVFGDFFINIIRVGETSGTLAQNLFYLAEELHKVKELQSKVRSAMVYPIIILVATLAITVFLTFVVFPKILPVFSGLNVELPPTTKFLIGVVDFSRDYGWQAVGGIVIIIIAFRFFLKVRVVKYILDRIILTLPVVSALVINVNMANFARVLRLLLQSGIKIVEAVIITSNTFDNLVYRQVLSYANERVKKGEQLADYLIENKKFFPLLFSGMVKIGENTGNLEENLGYLSEYYTEETDSRIRNLTSLLEPVLLLLMGLLVGFVAISIIMPIYTISSGLSQ